ncbi:hypothetical protein [Hydromonas duriensis]|uniref:Uncharacterized protein n=1 Tax=Hydromonas duriensis TaxID=1527608 RepID=A0A4R6Y9L7_9BURK|nr:hypothetical protein [Hydromonas duriensis]TDR32178.1 hypothetical protein DFR44_10561 [Hydromonas duriensis]
MRLRAPNRKAMTILLFGMASLLLWLVLEKNDTDTSWWSLAQKIALLGMGGFLTILGLNLTWKSMQTPNNTDKQSPTHQQ